MPDVEVKLPELGKDGPDKATLSYFLYSEGAEVKKGDDLCEMVTDKSAFCVPSPATGTLKKILVRENEVVKVGQALAIIETS